MKKQATLLAISILLLASQPAKADISKAKLVNLTAQTRIDSNEESNMADLQIFCIEGYKYIYLRGSWANHARSVAVVQMFEKVTNQNGKNVATASVPIPCSQ